MDFSSFPHRQVVLRIKTTMVRTSVCSFDFLPRGSPISPHYPNNVASWFLNVCSSLEEGLNLGIAFL
jgi:hypothetical protein